MSERDKFLTEAVGECWHEWSDIGDTPPRFCKVCEKFEPHTYSWDFSSWDGFGKLLKYMRG